MVNQNQYENAKKYFDNQGISYMSLESEFHNIICVLNPNRMELTSIYRYSKDGSFISVDHKELII